MRYILKTLFFLIVGCSQFKPETGGTKPYPRLDSLLSQNQPTSKTVLMKTVWLDESTESKEIALDSVGWASEFSFLEEINPNQAEYVGAFDELLSNGFFLSLKEGENGSLKKLSVLETDSTTSIVALIHEDKDIFVHHREIELILEDGIISSYRIDGFQKILYKDTIKFSVKGEFITP